MLNFKLKKRLRDFTLDISQEIGNETLVLIGHSGCGKSTTLKLLAGLVTAEEGAIQLKSSVLFDIEQKIDTLPEERNIGFVFQNYALFPHLTVEENVAYGISQLQSEERDERIQETLSFLGIEHLAHSKPAMLSGGEQQRVALARALVTQPKLLLLDEPLSALDVSTRSHVRAELKQLLKKLSIPTIVVTHDYEDARVLADRVAVMDQGKVIQFGTPSEITRSPANNFVAEFTGTNLVAIEKNDGDSSESLAYVAFDPWKVQISRVPQSSSYEWSGEIRDMSTIGGFMRLHIQGNSSFYADISIETYEKEDFQLGEIVYATVDAKEIRAIPSSANHSQTSYVKQQDPRKTVETNKGETKTVETNKGERKSPQRNRKWVYFLSLLLLVTFAATAYGFSSKPAGTPIEVEMFSLIAANATDPFNDIVEEFEKKHSEVNVEGTFAGTQIIRTQLEQGAKADLFLSADLEHIEAVKEQGLIDEFFPVSNNRVVIVVPKDDRVGIHSLEDLGTKKVKLVIGTDTVPIGKYTRQIFDNAKEAYGDGFPEKVMSNVVSLETNVKQVLQKVALGEAEAGMVYPTDVTPEFLEKVVIIDIPKEYNVVATNYISVPKKAPNKELAEEFMQLMLSDKGQEIFVKYKYAPVK
jgi:molybdenum ABC transporter ATP-binding protein/molybdenum ABC transporter molybdate-binding protein